MPRTFHSNSFPKGLPLHLVEKWIVLLESYDELSPEEVPGFFEKLLGDTLNVYEKQKGDLVLALQVAECALGDIGEAEREPEDDMEWCEKRAAEVLPGVRKALDSVKAKHSGIGHFLCTDDNS